MKLRIKLTVIAVLLLNCLVSLAAEPVKVACIGDSITFGYGLQSPFTQAYPAVLQQMLGDGYQVRNFGFSARTMAQTGDRPYMKEMMYQQAKDYQADIITIMLGTNDTKPQNWNAQDFEDACKLMVGELKQLPSKPKIYMCLPSTVQGEKWGINDSTIVHGVIPIIKKVARKNRIKIIDTHKATANMPDHFPDAVHPDAEASKVLAETVYKAIKK